MSRAEKINESLAGNTTNTLEFDDDIVNNPSHYQSFYKDGIDCITAMQSAFGKTATAHFCLTNAFKYIWRHSSKGKFQDIDKAIWYLNKYKEMGIIDLGD